MRKVLIYLLFSIILTNVKGQISDVAKNTELHMLGLRVFSLNHDSLRIHFKDKSYIDLFLKNNLIWEIKQYSTDSSIINIGSFKNGNGSLNINIKGYHYECNLNDGEFNGDFKKYRINRKNKYFLHTESHYEKGISNGMYIQYLGRRKTRKHIEIDYVDGVKMAMRTYGEYVPFLYSFGQTFPILLIVRNHDKLCREQFYENGRFKDSNCYTRIRSCDCP